MHGKDSKIWLHFTRTVDSFLGPCIWAVRLDSALLLDNNCTLIVSATTIMNKWLQFLILKIGPQKVGHMNLYAPNSASERVGLWLSLSN